MEPYIWQISVDHHNHLDSPCSFKQDELFPQAVILSQMTLLFTLSHSVWQMYLKNFTLSIKMDFNPNSKPYFQIFYLEIVHS